MTTRPWMPLYVADYRADTAHLSAAEHGAYLLLIMHYWQTGSLPIEDEPLARIACMKPSEWRKARAAVSSFFTAEWKHKRIDAEIAKASEISSKRRASAKQRHSKSDANVEQLDTHAGASSPSQSQQKEDTADAVPMVNGKYAFESGVIRLISNDLEKWRKAFVNLDLEAELLSLTEWAGTQGGKWFHAVAGALAKRNRDVGLRKNAAQKGLPLTPSGNPWPEAIT